MSKNSDKIKKLKTALKNNPSDIKILSEIVETYLRCGDAKNALKYINEFTKEFTDTNVQVQLLLGKIYEATKQVELVEHYYKQVFDWCEQNKDSRSIEIYVPLGNYWRGKDDARSFHCYNRAYQLGCVEPEVIEQMKQIFGTFVTLFNQGWFIVHHENKTFAYGSSNKKIASSIQLNSSESSIWCEQILNSLSQSQWIIDLEFFTLPVDIEKNGIVCQDSAQIKKLRHQFTPPKDELTLNRVAHRAMQCAVDSLEMGTQKALQSFVADWLSWEQDALSLAFSARLWHKLFHNGWFGGSLISLEKIFYHYKEILNSLPNESGLAKSNLVWQGLSYSISSSIKWNATLFQTLVVPSIHYALQKSDYFYADRLAIFTDFCYAQQPMTEEQQLLCRNAYVSETRQAGKLISDTFPKLLLSKEQKPVRIAFIVNLVFNDTSPIKVLFDILQKVSVMSSRPLIAKIYAFCGFDDGNHPTAKQHLIDRFRLVGVEIIDVRSLRNKHFNEDNYLERLSFLRKQLQKDEITVAIYLQCSTFFVIFASSVRLAPIQVFFSMAVEGTFRLPELDAYLSLGGTFEHTIMLHGHEWRIIPGTVGGSSIYSKTPDYDLQQAKQIRKQFPSEAVIIGSIGRTQKIDSDVFLDIIAEILYYHPQVIFLWFGREELPSVREKMRVRGILDRCLFQGWVNTYEYARVLDIHLDSYPFGTGITMFTSMAVGVPSVFFHKDEFVSNTNFSILSIGDVAIYPTWSGATGSFEQQNRVRTIFTDKNGENLFLYAVTPQEYVSHVRRLIEDRAFRYEVGKACQEFIKFMDEINAGEAFTLHIREIIEEHNIKNTINKRVLPDFEELQNPALLGYKNS